MRWLADFSLAPASYRRAAMALRAAVVLCFFGHGAFGLMGKAEWVPFFTTVGISESWAWRLMPLVGLHDFALAASALVRPRRALLLWCSAWCLWTALLRPLSGLSFWEVLERAGNFGPPLALVLLLGVMASQAYDPMRVRLASAWMRVCLATLLVGHAGFWLALHKPVLGVHLASVGLPASAFPVMGTIELALAALVLFPHRFAAAALVATLAWKLGTEALWITAGPAVNIFEFVERAGDYGLPLALLFLRRTQRSA